jgi:hypothetical protein
VHHYTRHTLLEAWGYGLRNRRCWLRPYSSRPNFRSIEWFVMTSSDVDMVVYAEHTTSWLGARRFGLQCPPW